MDHSNSCYYTTKVAYCTVVQGFPTYDHFKLSFELVTPTAEAKVDVYASGIRTNRPGVHKMQLIDELFLLFV